MMLDVGNFYFETPMDCYEYMEMSISLFSQHTIDQYNLSKKAKGWFVYLEIHKAVYGLPQARMLSS